MSLGTKVYDWIHGADYPLPPKKDDKKDDKKKDVAPDRRGTTETMDRMEGVVTPAKYGKGGAVKAPLPGGVHPDKTHYQDVSALMNRPGGEGSSRAAAFVHSLAKKYAKGGMVNPGKVERAMHEFKHGELHSGSKHGPLVTDRQQAIAIGISEAKNPKYAAAGGPIQGPSHQQGGVPIEAEGGEYIIDKDVTAFLGRKFFDDLVAHAREEMAKGENESSPEEQANPWDEMAQDDAGDMVPGGMGPRK